MKHNTYKNISFESSLKQLEEIVERLETGNVDLEKSIDASVLDNKLKNLKHLVKSLKTTRWKL